MKRREFSKAIKVTVIQRATRDGVTYCEKCGAIAKRFQIDHIIADALGGEPVLDNAMLICEPCYSEKNPQDTTLAAKVKRQTAKHLGADRPKGQLKSRGFAPSGKVRVERQSLPPRRLYEDVNNGH